jgi:hypothetical protein
MSHVRTMLDTHPVGTRVDAALLDECVTAILECAATCTACADACLGEQDVGSLVRCIRLNLDCADICETTGRLLLRLTEADPDVLMAQLQACAAACRACGEECQRHAGHHEHCAVCAKACRRCADACDRLITALAAA